MIDFVSTCLPFTELHHDHGVSWKHVIIDREAKGDNTFGSVRPSVRQRPHS